MLLAGLVGVFFILCAAFYYVNAFTSGLHPKKWFVAGLCLGPFLIPLFVIQRHIQWRKSVGFNNVYLRV